MEANELTFGVEIETTIPSGVIAVGAYRGGIQAEGLPAGWQAKHDGSIRASRGRMGCEFVSPVLKGAEGLRSLLDAIAAIKRLGGTVNDSTGLHVHVGFDRSNASGLQRLIALTANFEQAIYATTGTKRRERGNWCRGIQRHGSDEAVQRSGDRYQILNLTNLLRGGQPTVEFRAFAGTLNEQKIVGYVRLCLGMVERALKAKRKTNWVAKPVSATSPIHRQGEGQTALTRLFYQLGWTRGRQDHVHGWFEADGAPTLKQVKRKLMALARKYDAQ